MLTLSTTLLSFSISRSLVRSFAPPSLWQQLAVGKRHTHTFMHMHAHTHRVTNRHNALFPQVTHAGSRVDARLSCPTLAKGIGLHAIHTQRDQHTHPPTHTHIEHFEYRFLWVFITTQFIVLKWVFYSFCLKKDSSICLHKYKELNSFCCTWFMFVCVSICFVFLFMSGFCIKKSFSSAFLSSLLYMVACVKNLVRMTFLSYQSQQVVL